MRLAHPGPPAKRRIDSLPCRAHPLTLSLAPGLPLDRAIGEALRAAGVRSAWLWLRDLPAERLSYVIPAPPPGDGRVAGYSATRTLCPQCGARPRLLLAGLHCGGGPSGPVLHGHGLWADAAGRVTMGHLRPEESLLAGPATASGWALDGAVFRRAPDAETGFALFAPRPARRARPDGPAGAQPGWQQDGQPARLVRLRPHLDLAETLGGLATPATRILGLGSLVGARLSEAPALPGPATEFLILGGTMPALRLAAVAADGSWQEGSLAPGNAVCVTAELLLIG